MSPLNWKIFVDDGMVYLIADCKNTKANSFNASFATNREELATVIGICIYICVYKRRDELIRAICLGSERRMCGTQFMSRSEIEWIPNFIRFDMVNTRPTRRQRTMWAPRGQYMTGGSNVYRNPSCCTNTSLLTRH
jgi:hypothetical protein